MWHGDPEPPQQPGLGGRSGGHRSNGPVPRHSQAPGPPPLLLGTATPFLRVRGGHRQGLCLHGQTFPAACLGEMFVTLTMYRLRCRDWARGPRPLPQLARSKRPPPPPSPGLIHILGWLPSRVPCPPSQAWLCPAWAPLSPPWRLSPTRWVRDREPPSKWDQVAWLRHLLAVHTWREGQPRRTAQPLPAAPATSFTCVPCVPSPVGAVTPFPAELLLRL